MLERLKAIRIDGQARLGLSLAGVVLLLDQLTKWLVLDRLAFSPPGCLDFQRADALERAGMVNNCGHIDLSSFFDLTMVWNKGVSFGMLGADGPLGRFLLVGFSVAVALALIAGLMSLGPFKVTHRWQAIAFGLIIGGALGNAVDRALYGAVADFLNFSGLMFPWVFNIADVGINLGVAAIVLDVFILDRAKPATKM
ncbi:signal peptidase II [uncultured Maricaulis sp.]|uniref:signal peptidase II n=1 Tax=uncultured Maricaulis sp. TaxID=174710 RepID=UPI0030D9656C|tara:strand:+ start:8020 stop:8610 length:591 start_codon:yes stop_codon:yes gene_type:complete